MIVQELHAIQHVHGFLPENELRALAARTGTRLHRLQEVASFYPHFRLQKPAPVRVRICQDISCQLRGACDMTGSFQPARDELEGIEVDIQGVSCLGRCDRAPAVYIASIISEARQGSDASGNRIAAAEHESRERVHYYMNVDPSKLDSLIRETGDAVRSGQTSLIPPSASDADWQPRRHESWNIDVYRGKPDSERYLAVRQLVERRRSDDPNAPWRMEPALINDVEKALGGSMGGLDAESQRIFCSLFTANLLGMGGAGGRTYKKWFEVHEARGDVKYVVCNGDESEPGTFKDREILLRAPHLVVEAVVLAGLLLGAQQGYIYIRHEFAEQIAAVGNEIRRAESLHVCGPNILGSDVNFPVEVFVSPGGYICGEQTALIEALEDKRAEPRNRPPELQTNGLWNCPTLLNNVETFAWVPAIVLKDNGRWFARQGSNPGKSHLGRRFFSISGDVARPGAYEVPIGIKFGQLISEYAGGMAEGREFKAAALSGPSGGFLPRSVPVEYLADRWVTKNLPPGATHFDLLNLELDIQETRDMGIMMGAGIVVFGDQADMVATALSATTFYRNESCGKCVPCRIGSQKLVELITDIAGQKYTLQEIYGDGVNQQTGKQGLVLELAETMKLTAICGLGTVASNPLTTLLNFFRTDVERYTQIQPQQR